VKAGEKPLNSEMRKHALRRYLVLRVKLIELFDINAMYQALIAQLITVPNPVQRAPSDFAAALRTVQLSWFAILVDKSKDGMDAIKLWVELFPKHRAQIEEVWARIEPAWTKIRAFRDKAGFHADKPAAFFKSRREILGDQNVKEAIDDFHKLLGIILKAESEELPDLEDAVDSFLGEMENEHQVKYDSAEFKRYLMLGKPAASNS
jgi:hypothetical protein